MREQGRGGKGDEGRKSNEGNSWRNARKKWRGDHKKERECKGIEGKEIERKGREGGAKGLCAVPAGGCSEGRGGGIADNELPCR